MFLEPIISLFIIRHLRTTFQTKVTMPHWEKLFVGAMATAITVLVASAILNDNNIFIQLVGHGLAFALVYVVIKYPEFRSSKSFIYSMVPVLVISLIVTIVQAVAPDFYNSKEDFFDVAILFAMLWVGTMWMITKRQRKALEKEREETARLHREQMITEKVKAELELQVADRTAALTLQKEELEKALSDLKSTQSQLIQSEKMASLGELTAGIAHEIQNPLNFINNFSELNGELIDEIKAAIDKQDFQEVQHLVTDIANNEQKINHHGKRADAIVKGMLLHSRSSGGNKEPVNINELADEYLRLAYHGLRAKDKSFNATFKTSFDESIKAIRVVPEDLGRVLLNLINNAFYAVTERKKQQPQNYEPTVQVSTRSMGNHVELEVRDNGNGIPDKVLDKIFQPFFTTKPAGQGTGLGLSLSYDIVKAHGGRLLVESKYGGDGQPPTGEASIASTSAGTTFRIILPA
ncbi:MAG TPA: ATP-binding protein [Flavitalea sp.]|nr:ATP-binding protein [Flavitalea sp.]